MKAKNNTKTLARLIDEQYGKNGTPGRNAFDKGYQTFKYGQFLQTPRQDILLK